MQALPQLAKILRRDGYDEAAVRRILDIPDIPGIDPQTLPGLIRRCREDGSPAAAWIAYFLLGQPHPHTGPWVDRLTELGLITPDGQPLCSLSPCRQIYILADRTPTSRAYALARNTTPSGSSLDLFCGPGTQTILNGITGQPSLGVDPDPRNLAFGRLNAELNSLPNCQFQAELPDGKFALITINLPFANPAREALPADPPEHLIVELTKRLNAGGTLAVACGYPIHATPPLNNLGPGFSVLQLTCAQTTLEHYATSIVDRARLFQAFGLTAGEQAYELEVQSRLESFERAGLRGVAEAVFLISPAEQGSRKEVACPVQEARPRWAETPPQAHSQSKLAQTMRAAFYDEAGLRRLLGIAEPLYTRDQRAALVHRCRREDSALARLCAFWILEQPGAFQDEELEKLGLIGDGRAQATLFPCLGHYFFTDLMFNPRKDQVYWLGPDSLALARCCPRTPRRRALDLCTGSGVQAILNAAHCDESWAVDLNPRAVDFARMNGRLNEAKISVVQGDLYDALAPGKFDLITANPPFVPTPRRDLHLFRSGGESGEELTAAIIRALPDRLEVGGTLALVSQCPVIRGSRALDRVENWLGSKRGWGLAQLRFGYLNRESLIAGHAATRAEFEEDLDSYARQGIEGADLAVTFVTRIPPDSPNWRSEAELEMPRGSISDRVESWLKSS